MRRIPLAAAVLILLAACHHDGVDAATSTPIVLTAVRPPSFAAGDTVSLQGEGLVSLAPGGGVRFGAMTVTPLAGGTDTLVRAVAPPCLATGTIAVSFVAGTVTSNALTASYVARDVPLALAPFAALTVNSAQLGSCLTLPGDGATYLVVGQYASVGDPTNVVSWQVGTALAPPAATAASTTHRVSAPRANRVGLRFETMLRGVERTAAPRARAEAMAMRRGDAARSAALVPIPAPGTRRTFQVVAALDGSSFTTATARLVFTGDHVLVYVDTIGPGFSDAQYEALGAEFDRELYAIDENAFGAESDIDRNGRVIALFTPKINALVATTNCAFAGYVTGFFYATDLTPGSPNSNKGEIFYSYVPDSTGTYSCPHTAASVMQVVPGTFLHQLQHMISFNQHVLVRGGAAEDVWLNEGLGQIAEELGSEYYEAKYPAPSGRSTTTQLFPDSASPFIQPQLLDAYVYLNSTRAHSVTSYDGGGSLEERGATWLFLRWLASQKGEDIFGRLEQTSNTGVANVEAQTGEPFAALFGDFSAALAVDSIPGVPRTSVPTRFRFGSRNLRLLMAREATIETFPNPWPLPVYALGIGGMLSANMIPGTMFHSVITPPAGGGAVTLNFTEPESLPFPVALGAQVTIFRMPP